MRDQKLAQRGRVAGLGVFEQRVRGFHRALRVFTEQKGFAKSCEPFLRVVPSMGNAGDER
jgi:hypothetical protein